MTKYLYIRVWRVPSHLKSDLNNISQNHEEKIGAYLKPKIKAFIEQFPEEIRNGSKKEKQQKSELTIHSISQKTIDELKNVADFIGIDVSSLLKMEMYRIAQQAPAHQKRPVTDY